MLEKSEITIFTSGQYRIHQQYRFLSSSEDIWVRMTSNQQLIYVKNFDSFSNCAKNSSNIMPAAAPPQQPSMKTHKKISLLEIL